MMQIFRDLKDYADAPSVATIGFFDGVHLGHRFLIEQLKVEAHAKGVRSLIITFSPHPREVLKADFHAQLLSTPEERRKQLEQLGVEACVVLPFNQELASYTAFEFLQKIVCEQLHVKQLLIGYDHRFGRGRAEGFEQYAAYGKQLGVEITRSEPFVFGGITISSSTIRRLLAAGNAEQAAALLGYPYAIEGTVVHGRQIGRALGFPTANLQPCDSRKLLPASGVYAVKVEAGEKMYKGMLNIGTRPTFEQGGDTRSVEVHIFNFAQDIYGATLRVEFLRRLRPERKFDSSQDLVKQMEEDKRNAMQ